MEGQHWRSKKTNTNKLEEERKAKRKPKHGLEVLCCLKRDLENERIMLEE